LGRGVMGGLRVFARSPKGMSRMHPWVDSARTFGEHTGAGNRVGGGGVVMLGMSLLVFTIVHVIISLVAIVSGFVVLYGMFTSDRMPTWTAVFLSTTVATSVTGFMFPFTEVKPSHIFGVISLVVLALALAGLYLFHLGGRWRSTYVISSLVALYLNTFVLIVQSFQKVPFLTPLAPTQSEPPFAVAQLALLVFIIWAGVKAVHAFHPQASAPVAVAA
jgi:hypothetical protein